MRTLSVVGTAAMFLVGGGILVHGLPALAHGIEGYAIGLGTLAQAALPTLANGLVGVAAGGLIVGAVTLARRLLSARQPAS
jgi:predicted DNA repair protein MutK